MMQQCGRDVDDGAGVDDNFLSSVDSSSRRNPSTRLSHLQVETASIQKVT